MILGWLPAPGDAYRCVASVIETTASRVRGRRCTARAVAPGSRLRAVESLGHRAADVQSAQCQDVAVALAERRRFCNTPKPVTPEELALNVLPGPIPVDECTQPPSCRRTDVRSPKRPSIRASRSRIMKFSSPTSRSQEPSAGSPPTGGSRLSVGRRCGP